MLCFVNAMIHFCIVCYGKKAYVLDTLSKQGSNKEVLDERSFCQPNLISVSSLYMCMSVQLLVIVNQEQYSNTSKILNVTS